MRLRCLFLMLLVCVCGDCRSKVPTTCALGSSKNSCCSGSPRANGEHNTDNTINSRETRMRLTPKSDPLSLRQI